MTKHSLGFCIFALPPFIFDYQLICFSVFNSFSQFLSLLLYCLLFLFVVPLPSASTLFIPPVFFIPIFLTLPALWLFTSCVFLSLPCLDLSFDISYFLMFSAFFWRTHLVLFDLSLSHLISLLLSFLFSSSSIHSLPLYFHLLSFYSPLYVPPSYPFVKHFS
jgi:hypothetical protein